MIPITCTKPAHAEVTFVAGATDEGRDRRSVCRYRLFRLRSALLRRGIQRGTRPRVASRAQARALRAHGRSDRASCLLRATPRSEFAGGASVRHVARELRSEEHTSELQS